MGIKIYYIIEILIYSGMAILAIKPEFVPKSMLQSNLSKRLIDDKRMRVLMGIVALVNVGRCFYEFTQ